MAMSKQAKHHDVIGPHTTFYNDTMTLIAFRLNQPENHDILFVTFLIHFLITKNMIVMIAQNQNNVDN